MSPPTTLDRAGIISLAVEMPTRLMDNQHWRTNHKAMVEGAESAMLSRVWQAQKDGRAPTFDEEMAPYLSDPFRGADQRRWLERGQPVLSIEVKAARAALKAAHLTVDDIDLAIVGSFFPDQQATGNAAFVAKELGLKAAWNLESACSTTVVGLQTACALIDAGQHERILVITSCAYSKAAPETESISWANGDGAAAIVVAKVPAPAGLLGGAVRSTKETCGALSGDLIIGEDGKPTLRMTVHESANRLLRGTAQETLKSCVDGALKSSGLALRDVDFFIFHTPVAWYHAFCARVLEIDASKTISTHSLYANTAAVMTPTNLLHAAHEGKVKPGSVVLLYAIGSVSNASAAIVRWGDVGLGPLPPPLRGAGAI